MSVEMSVWCDIVYLAGVAWCCLGEEEEAGGSSRRMVPATAWLCSRMRTRCSSEPISRVLTFWYALNWLRRSSSSPDSCRRLLATLVMSWNALCCASFNLRKHAGSLGVCTDDPMEACMTERIHQMHTRPKSSTKVNMNEEQTDRTNA